MAALISNGPAPQFLWWLAPRSFTSQDLLEMLLALPRQGGRPVVVLDNGSVHVSKVVKQAPPELASQGIELYYLPPTALSSTLSRPSPGTSRPAACPRDPTPPCPLSRRLRLDCLTNSIVYINWDQLLRYL